MPLWFIIYPLPARAGIVVFILSASAVLRFVVSQIVSTYAFYVAVWTLAN